ncbi:MAG: DNA modification methylase [Betaproteobacteria bacterium]|nr:DNA modification methylase [Betaproteobacteria bacterium]
MFPLEFPMGILERYAKNGQKLLDPFCGRGTANFAARVCGLSTLGVDSSPVAAAITAAKLANTDTSQVLRAASRILGTVPSADVPTGEFWDLAFHPTVLQMLCRLREGLITDCSSDARRALRGILLGALHGPITKDVPSYFSNQCMRTYAPKPAYAVKYWRFHGQMPSYVDVLALVRRRAERYLSGELPISRGESRLGDSRDPFCFSLDFRAEFDWIITSPPYYGMRTYIPDQWLRYWFVGGPSTVSYSSDGQLDHGSPHDFIVQLKQVWENAAKVCKDGARLVIRFGGISDRKATPLELIKQSFSGASWKINTTLSAGTSKLGRRQADSFLTTSSTPIQEYDVWAELR